MTMTPDLPSPGSEWIRLSDLTVCQVRQSSMVPTAYFVGPCYGVITLETLRREYVENGPVMLERLEACGWTVSGKRASDPSGCMEWNQTDGLVIWADHRSGVTQTMCPLPGCTDMLGVLWAMRLVGK